MSDMKVIAYKGFDKNFKCRDFQFEIGKTYTYEGDPTPCQSGFHACEYALDIFTYYAPAGSKFAEVELSGKMATHEGDSKIASASITINAEISITQIVQKSVDWILSRIKNTKTESNTGNWSAATNTGYQSAASVEGKHSVAISTGYQSKAKASITGAIVLCHRTVEGEIVHIRASKVGDNGIKPDTWYMLDESGEFLECA